MCMKCIDLQHSTLSAMCAGYLPQARFGVHDGYRHGRRSSLIEKPLIYLPECTPVTKTSPEKG